MPVTLTPTSASDYRYTTVEAVTTFLDSLNFAVHTDADRDGDSDAAAAVQGIVSAEARVDLHTGGPYTFTDDSVGEIAAETFNRWSYVLSAYQFAAKRGFSGNEENEFIRNRDEVLEEMRQFREGELDLAGAVPPDEDEVNNLGIPTVAKSDGTAVEASDLPYLCPSPPRPYVWP